MKMTHQGAQARETPPQQYYAQHDHGGSAEFTTTLAHAISNATAVDVSDVGFALNDHFNPAAFDRLFKPKGDGTPRINAHFSFTMWGYQVTVYSDGRIVITPPRRPVGNARQY